MGSNPKCFENNSIHKAFLLLICRTILPAAALLALSDCMWQMWLCKVKTHLFMSLSTGRRRKKREMELASILNTHIPGTFSVNPHKTPQGSWVQQGSSILSSRGGAAVRQAGWGLAQDPFSPVVPLEKHVSLIACLGGVSLKGSPALRV